MKKQTEEMRFLESVTHTYVTSESPQDRAIKSMAVRTFAPYLKGDAIALEMGCSDGFMTSLIAPLVGQLQVVDGSRTFIDIASRRGIRNAEFHYSLFENFESSIRFDCVFACYVLEHVADARAFLTRARSLLKSNGLLFLVVPNARALSRQLARHMGLLDELHSLTQNDRDHGHRRVYDRNTLNRELHLAGLNQISQGGLLLKILADFQMDQLISGGVLGEAQLEGLYKLGLEYPDLSGSLFSICRPT